MKLPPALLHTLAVAVASIGVAGCVPVAADAPATAPANEAPKAPAATEPTTPRDPQGNPQEDEPVNKPNNNRPRDPCPGCGLG